MGKRKCVRISEDTEAQMIEGIHIIDDVIPKSYQDEIERIFLTEAEWVMRYDVTYGKDLFDKLQAVRPDLKPRPGFHHALIVGSQIRSPIHNFLKPLIIQGLDKINKKFESATLGRSFLQLPIIPGLHKDIRDPLHVDSYEPHMVFLYYVVSSDGHTLLSDCRSEWGDSPQNCTEYDYKRCSVLKKVKPQKGRLVMFDGRIYHAAEQSKQDLRCIINYNLQVSDK